MGVWGSECWLKGTESVRIYLFKRRHEQLLGGDISNSILGITLDQNWLIGSWFDPQGLYMELYQYTTVMSRILWLSCAPVPVLWYGLVLTFALDQV